MGKKGGSSTTVQSYQPTEQEIRLQKQAADYSEAVAPNALWLNNVAQGLLKDSLGTIQVDYNQLLNNANSQVAGAQQGVAGLATSGLPEEWQNKMEASIASGVNNTMGKTLASLGARGILDSSTTNTAMNDISKNAADTMAQQYQNNISILNGLYGQQASLAGNQISMSAAAQEAAQQPALNLWNASLGLNSGGTLGALNAVSGQGTTTSTTSGGGGGLFSGLFNGTVGAGITAWCFVAETPILMADGEQKAIRDIEVGDKILSYDHVRDRRNVEEVIEIMEPHESDTYVVICQDDKGYLRDVETTLSQPLMLSDGTFRDVGMLRIGERLKNVGIVKCIAFNGKRKVYDFKITSNRKRPTYFANGFVVQAGTDEWGEVA